MRKEIEKYIIQYLDKNNLKYKKLTKNTININFKSDDIRISLFVVFEDDGWLFFVTSDKFREKWNLDNKEIFAMTIAKLNFHIRKGSFQFDASDGEIRYKIFTGLTTNMICQETIEKLFQNDLSISVNMIIRHENILLKATKGELSNEDFTEME